MMLGLELEAINAGITLLRVLATGPLSRHPEEEESGVSFLSFLFLSSPSRAAGGSTCQFLLTVTDPPWH